MRRREDQLACHRSNENVIWKAQRSWIDLICGDVGFGKTEVAIRAAFKVVQEEKQAMRSAGADNDSGSAALQYFLYSV